MELKEERLSRAISAFSRRQILRLLVDKEMTVKEVAEKTGQSVSLASRHLKLLYDLCNIFSSSSSRVSSFEWIDSILNRAPWSDCIIIIGCDLEFEIIFGINSVILLFAYSNWFRYPTLSPPEPIPKSIFLGVIVSPFDPMVYGSCGSLMCAKTKMGSLFLSPTISNWSNAQNLISLRLSIRKHDYNIFKILTIVLSIPLILIFGLGGFSLIIILYLFLNVIRNLWSLI